MLVKTNVVLIDRAENLREVGELMREYIKHVLYKHICEEGALIYSWDGFEKDEGQFKLPIIKAYGIHVLQVSGGKDIASVMFMTSGRLGELFETMKFSRVIILHINNTNGDKWVSIGSDNIDEILNRAIVATKANEVNIDVEFFKYNLAAIRFLGDLH